MSVTPSDFRPITIVLVVVRYLHKILVERLSVVDLADLRQRCMDDDFAEDITALATLLDAKGRI